MQQQTKQPLQRTRWFFHVANKLSKVHKHALFDLHEEKNTHIHTNKFLEEYEKLKGQGMARGGGFYFAFYIFLNAGLSDSKATLTAVLDSLAGGPVQFQHTSDPFQLLPQLPAPGSLRAAVTDRPGLPGGTSVSPALPSPCHFDPGPAPPNPCSRYSCSSHGLTWPL